MPSGPDPKHPIDLTTEQRNELERRARKQTAPHRRVVRAQIILKADDGEANRAIARELDVAPNTVRLWRQRFHEDGLDGLEDKPREGRPPEYGDEEKADAKALACRRPEDEDVPQGRLSLQDITDELADRYDEAPSRTTVWTWLSEAAIRPWQYRSWLFPHADGFLEQACPVLDLYEGQWAGQTLEADTQVWCLDEKRIEVTPRHHDSQPPKPGQQGRVEAHHDRAGTATYQAAMHVDTGRVLGRFAPRNTKQAFDAFVEDLMAQDLPGGRPRCSWSWTTGPRTIQPRSRTG